MEGLAGGKLDRMVRSWSVTEQPMKESDSSCDACRAKMRTPSSVTWRARDTDSDLERKRQVSSISHHGRPTNDSNLWFYLSCGQPTAMDRMPSLVIWSARGPEPLSATSADWAWRPFLPRARLAALHCT